MLNTKEGSHVSSVASSKITLQTPKARSARRALRGLKEEKNGMYAFNL